LTTAEPPCTLLCADAWSSARLLHLKESAGLALVHGNRPRGFVPSLQQGTEGELAFLLLPSPFYLYSYAASTLTTSIFILPGYCSRARGIADELLRYRGRSGARWTLESYHDGSACAAKRVYSRGDHYLCKWSVRMHWYYLAPAGVFSETRNARLTLQSCSSFIRIFKCS
jgi:hypothetical protein